ncbi:MAG: hydroxylamine reductase [Kiritimatiellae bacterium]|nr:hydroxylamine reductase [Kiritimatiellia bacterium]
MFCFQCQETARNQGCTVRGVCGKLPETATLQDALIHTVRGIAFWGAEATKQQINVSKEGLFAMQSLFATITNANFDNARFVTLIGEALKQRDELRAKVEANAKVAGALPDCAVWQGTTEADYAAKGAEVGVLSNQNEDTRSLEQLITLGLKGLSAYADHAAMLGYEDDGIYASFMEAMADTTRGLSVDQLVARTLQTGHDIVKVMALLDKANTETYGHPEITQVNIGVRGNPGILISGHDLHDMQELLDQTEGTGVDVYTHSEMLPANYYPAFKKYKHFVGNYGSSWWKQNEDFTTFNGPILMTTNCIIPLKDAYKDRIFTTGMAGWPGVPHIAERPKGGKKDFSAIIALAKKCPPPTEIETGTIVGGFAHNQVLALADKVVDAVKSGAIKRFVVMAGCDGRHKTRSYFTDVAEALPKDTVILTAGCAKYRYNKLNLGDIGGIPRVLDAGQCNDSYSLAVIALKLKEVFGLEDVNQLPLSFDIAWYEQKAVAVLLALLALGFKGMRLGPTLPAFLSPNVAKVLVENFHIKPTGDVEADVAAMMAGN